MTPKGGHPRPASPHHRGLHPAAKPPAPGFATQPLRHILSGACLAAEEHQKLRDRHRCAPGDSWSETKD
ncbi:hypothetical protein P7K49_002179 [Saguinus oedipus]|uniref:Uncharacterized protein n=1 Tax=Saguinus oedipus TaxID=9490 RepID=A0ABQ9WGK2_SAGOE|nr:hypothetical protein P7K49_002179 [Saguinus oedipus]